MRSSASLISLLYPNFLRTVHVVSRRPFSMNSAWRKRKPVKVSPRSLTPSGNFSETTLLTPTISEGCNGALKHLTCLQVLLDPSFIFRRKYHDLDRWETCLQVLQDHSWIVRNSILGHKTQFRTKVANKEAKETWKSFNSASLRAPSLSWSQRINIRFKARTHLGLKVCVSWSNSGPVGWSTAFCA
jgi:hypothetical protein